MWTTENRPRYNRDKLRYPSDLTDEEWALVEPMIPPAKHGGRRRTVVVREVVNGVMYVLSTGCQWRYLPKDLPPKSTVHDYLSRWNYDGTIERLHHALYVQCREAAGRQASPTACVIDSQSVSTRRLPPCRRERAFDLRGVCMSAVKIKGSQQHGDHHWG
jgi:transposase